MKSRTVISVIVVMIILFLARSIYSDHNLKKIDGWDIKKKENDIYFLEKNFTFKNFSESQKFVNEVGNIAESQGHHPDIIFGWGYAKVQIFTHKIKGLVESDFILAAKINKI